MQRFTGYEYLLIDIANNYGLDKEVWDDRIAWTRQNLSSLETFSGSADEPVLFNKAVRALRKAEKGEPINHIMGLDATASGIQLMTCMAGCEISAPLVNLVDTGERMDLYGSMAHFMNSNVTRLGIKKPIMTFFYGSTAQPKKAFGNSRELLNFYKTMETRIPGPYKLMLLFQSYWNPEAEYYSWVMPDKHVVKIPITDTEIKKIEVDEFHHATFRFATTVIKPQKKGRSLAANIVHSVDAWVLREMIRRAHLQGFQLATIHDCFYAHPNYMNQVRQNYLDILVELTRMNLVQDILSQINGRTIQYSKPAMGIDSMIKTAEYALS